MENGVLIPWDLEEIPLQIKTDSITLGSGDDFKAKMYDKDGNFLSSVFLVFRAKIEYWLPRCTAAWIKLPVQPPEKVEKIWTIAKTETVLIIMCNGLELLRYQFADSSDSRCANLGGDVVDYISFNSAPKFYRGMAINNNFIVSVQYTSSS